MKTLLYLKWRGVAGYVRVTLRSPKRLIPIILMAFWVTASFGMMLLMPMIDQRKMHGVGVPPPFPVHIQLPAILPATLFLILSGILFSYLQMSFSRSMLVFSLSDIDFLFPTPIPRRAIMALKLLGLYSKAAMSAAFASFFLLMMTPQLRMILPTANLGGTVFAAVLGAFLFAAVIVNVSTLINLTATFREGKKWWLAWVVRGANYALVLFVVGSALWSYSRTGNALEGLVRATQNPAVATLLFPARLFADLIMAALGEQRSGVAIELAIMIVLAVVSYVLVLLRDENPYEPSLAISARTAAMRAAARAGGFSRLRAEQWKSKPRSANVQRGVPPFGRGAAALIWKNLNVSVRTSGKAIVAIPMVIAAALVISRATLPRRAVEEVIQIMVPIILGYAVFFTAIFSMQSFRADLKQANILKPMPFPSWQIIAAQSVQGTLMAVGITWTVVILIGVTYGLPSNSLLPLIALGLPFIIYDLLCWQSAAAIIYPKLEDPAQQWLGGLVGMAAAGIAVGPPAGAGVLGWLLFHRLIYSNSALNIGLAPVVLLIAATSAVMAAVGIALSGYLYSRFDPSEE